jgi:phosphoribosylanthranilate isomerase
VTRVKICGITRHEDAEHAVQAGAWAIGFVLHPPSARACDPAVAAGISRALRRRVATVGVFVDPTLGDVAHHVEAAEFSHVQLHGDVGPAFCAEVARRTGAKVIKAEQVRSGEEVQHVVRYRFVDYHLLDGRSPGSGEPWDWALAAQRRSKVPLILSGGLTPDNVVAGIAAVRPYAVDVASGTDAVAGIKDPAKVEAFIAAASAAAEAPAAAEAG